MSRVLSQHVPHEDLEFIYYKALDRLSDGLVESLNDFIKEDLKGDFELVHFKIQQGGAESENSTIWICLEEKDGPVFSGKKWEFFDISELPILSPELRDAIAGEFDLEKLLFRWFSECWWKAGGWYYPRPAAVFAGGTLMLASVILTKARP